jgi:hypothetical protein
LIMLDFAGVRAAGDAFLWGVGGVGLDFSWAWQARGLNYNLVISIMVCLFVGRVVVRLSRRCAGFHAPAGVLS